MLHDVLENDSGADAISSVSSAGYGDTAIVGSGSSARVAYTANPGFTGVDSFTYTVMGSDGSTSSANVSVTVLAQSSNQADWTVDKDFGSPSIVTFGGFDTSSSSGFETDLAGSYTLTDTGVTTRTYNGDDGIAESHTIAWTLTITSQSNGAGGWTITEDYQATTSVEVSGNDVVSTPTGEETFGYTLTATDVSSGTSGGHAYSITANADQLIDFKYDANDIGGGSGSTDGSGSGSGSSSGSGDSSGSGGDSDSTLDPDAVVMSGRWGSESHIWFDTDKSVDNSGNQTSFSASGGVSLKQYSDDVTYTQEDPDFGTITGTVSMVAEVTTTYVINGDTGTAWDTTSYELTLNGSGSYTLDVGLAEVTGSVTDYVHVVTATSHTIDIEKNYAESTWVATGGTGSGSASTTVRRTLQGGGSFSLAEEVETGGADGEDTATTTYDISGSVSHHAFAEETTQATWQQEMGATGLFYTTSGNGAGTSRGDSYVELNGTGTFETVTPELTINGQVTDYFIRSEHAYQYQTQSSVVSGFWVYTGAGYDLASNSQRIARQGSGTTDLDVHGNTITLTVELAASDESNVWGRTDAVLDSNEEWKVTDGYGAGSMSSYSEINYNGSGPFTSTPSGDGTGDSIPAPEITGTISISGKDVSSGHAAWDLDWSWDGEQDVWMLSSGTGYNLASGYSQVNYEGSGSYEATIDDWQIGGELFISGVDRSDYAFETTMEVIDGEWVSSGSGSTSGSYAATASGNSWGEYSQTEMTLQVIDDETFTTTSTTTASFEQAIYNDEHVDTQLNFELDADEEWEITSSNLSGSASGYSSGTTTGGFSFENTGPGFFNAGSGGFSVEDFHDDSYAYSGEWDEASEIWSLTGGTGSTLASGTESNWFAASGTFEDATDEWTVSGNHATSASGGGNYQFDQALSLEMQSEEWSVASASGLANSWSEATQEYSGNGSFSTSVEGGYYAGGMSVWGGSSDNASRSLTFDWDDLDELWVESGGSGSAEFLSDDHTSYSGSGEVTTTGSDYQMTFTTDVDGGTDAYVSGSFAETYDVDDEQWKRTEGEMTVDLHADDNFDSTLDGSFNIPGAEPDDPPFVGTISGSNHTSSDTYYTSYSIWDTAEDDWDTTGTGNVESVDEGLTIYTGSMAIDIPLPGGSTLSGSVGVVHEDNYENNLSLQFIYDEPASGGGDGESDAWELTGGSLDTFSQQEETITIDATGGFTIDVPELNGEITGSASVDGLTTNDNLFQTAWELDTDTEQFEQTGGAITTTSVDSLQIVMVGGGSFDYTSDDGELWLAGTLSLSYNDNFDSNFITSLEHDGEGWGRLDVSGSGRHQVWESFDISGNGGFSTINALGEVSGTAHLTANYSGNTDYSTDWSLAADGSINASGNGTGTIDEHMMLQMEGQGGYTRDDSHSASNPGDGDYASYSATMTGSQQLNLLAEQSRDESWIDQNLGDGQGWQRSQWNATITDQLQLSTSYNGTGTYQRSDEHHDVSGSIWESGAFDIDRSETYGQNQAGGGPWNYFGTGHTNITNNADYGYSGSGSYNETIDVGAGIALDLTGGVNEHGSNDRSYSANVQLQVDGVTGTRTYTGDGGGSQSSVSHYSHSASGTTQANFAGGGRENTATFSGAQSVTADASSLYSWDEDVHAPTGRLVTIGEDHSQQSTSQASRIVSYSGGYTREGTMTGGTFSLTGTLEGQWQTGGSTSSSTGSGWSGHIDSDGGGGGSTLGEAPPVEVTDSYSHFDHRIDRAASGSEQFESIEGSYTRTIQGVEVTGTVTDQGRTSFSESYDLDNNSVDGKTISTHSQRNQGAMDGYQWSYSGSGSETSSSTDAWDVTYDLTVTVEEDGSGSYVNRFENDSTQQWDTNGALVHSEQTEYSGGVSQADHHYWYLWESSWAGGKSSSNASGGVTTVDRHGTWSIEQEETLHHESHGGTTVTTVNGNQSESSSHYSLDTREVDAYEHRDSYDFTSHLWDVGDTEYYHETVNEEYVDAEDHLSSSSETIDGSTTQQSDASGFAYYSPQYTYYTRTTYDYGGGSSDSGMGGGGSSASVEEQTISSGYPYYDPSASEYEYLGDAGAYEDFPDLPADWSSLQSESSPYVFGGGWENHFTDSFTIQASVASDQDAMQHLVEELDISDQIQAVEAGVADDYAEDIEQQRQAEMDRQEDLSGPAPGSFESDLAAVNMNGRRERAISRFYTFADAWTSMTPGAGLIHDGHQAITGENAVTGEELSGFDRAIAGVGVAASFIPGAGYVDDAFRTAGKSARISGKIVESGDGIAGGVKVSKNGKRIDTATEAVKATPKPPPRIDPSDYSQTVDTVSDVNHQAIDEFVVPGQKWYHGTDVKSAEDIMRHGLDRSKLLGNNPVEGDKTPGFFVTDLLSDAADYARVRSAERGFPQPGVVLEFDDIEIGRYLQGVGKLNEAIIPFSVFHLIPKPLKYRG